MYDRDALLAATDLRALADELLGPHVGSDQHPMWSCPSPTHAQTGRTPPVSVFTSRWDEERWHCHGCGDGGTAIDLLMRARGFGAREALDELSNRTGIRPEPSDHSPGLARPPSRFVKEIIDRRLHARTESSAGPAHLAALEAYVAACANELWTPAGTPARRWLNERRGLPEAVLRANRIGADLGNPGLPRPEGICRHSGAVILPVHVNGDAIYFQSRVMHPKVGRPRYLNPGVDLAPNPKVSIIEPDTVSHPEIIVTEGAIDALSAASAGYRAAAVLSAGYPDRHVALQISRLDGPLVLAMDPDSAGQEASVQLARHLDSLRRPAAVLEPAPSDLNGLLTGSAEWTAELVGRVARVALDGTAHQLGVASRELGTRL